MSSYVHVSVGGRRRNSVRVWRTFSAWSTLATVLLVMVMFSPPLAMVGIGRYEQSIPLVKTEAVAFDSKLEARMREMGIREFKTAVSKYGAPGIFKFDVNGRPGNPNLYSTIFEPSQMYRVVLTDNGVVVYVRADCKKEMAPGTFREMMQRDITQYLDAEQASRKEAVLIKTWD